MSNRQWPEWLVQDQRFVHLRPDVLSYETEPLAQDLDVVGPVLARLFASTSGTDGDWIVKLIDVYPEDRDEPLAGYQLMIANDVFRGAVPQELRAARAARLRAGRAIPDRPALDRSPLQEGAQDHGADPEHLVPADRSQSAEVRRPISSRPRRRTTSPRPSAVYRTAERATHIELRIVP